MLDLIDLIADVPQMSGIELPLETPPVCRDDLSTPASELTSPGARPAQLGHGTLETLRELLGTGQLILVPGDDGRTYAITSIDTDLGRVEVSDTEGGGRVDLPAASFSEAWQDTGNELHLAEHGTVLIPASLPLGRYAPVDADAPLAPGAYFTPEGNLVVIPSPVPPPSIPQAGNYIWSLGEDWRYVRSGAA